MGEMTAYDLADEAHVGNLTKAAAIYAHLRTNCYPPTPPELCTIAIEAVEAYPDDPEFQLPDGILFRGEDIVRATDLIDSLHLWPFIPGECADCGEWTAHDRTMLCDACEAAYDDADRRNGDRGW